MALLMAIGVDEGKLDTFHVGKEHKIKFKDKFFI